MVFVDYWRNVDYKSNDKKLLETNITPRYNIIIMQFNRDAFNSLPAASSHD